MSIHLSTHQGRKVRVTNMRNGRKSKALVQYLDAPPTNCMAWVLIAELDGTGMEHESLDRERRFAPDGWQTILQETHEKLLAINPTYEVAQIKTKFGGLRYYLGGDDDMGRGFHEEANAIIEEAEVRCSKTCMDCGVEAKQERVSNYSYAVLCPDHLAEAKARRL